MINTCPSKRLKGLHDTFMTQLNRELFIALQPFKCQDYTDGKTISVVGVSFGVNVQEIRRFVNLLLRKVPRKVKHVFTFHWHVMQLK